MFRFISLGRRRGEKNIDTGAAPTRFIGDQTTRFAQYREAAQKYVANIAPEAVDWLYRKPYDHTERHPQFFRLMYTALNLIGAMHLPAGARVLEVGAGPGWLTEILLMLGYRVDAVEPSADLIHIAKSRCEALEMHHKAKAAKNVTFHEATIEEVDLPGEAFDGVLFYDALHHIIDERRCLAICFASLKRGGMIGIVEGAWDPDNKHLEEELREEMAVRGTLENPFTTAYLDRLLAEIGFDRIVRYVPVNGFVAITELDRPARRLAMDGPEYTNDLTARKPA